MKRFFATAATITGAVVLSSAGVVVLFLALGWFGFYPLIVLTLLTGWLLYSFIHYRYGRQEEFLQLLRTVAETRVPLVPALRAYAHDRPHGTQREAWIAILLFVILPGYYWLWHRQHNFDRKVLRLADLLEEGVPLDRALETVRGLASAETRLAVSIGQASGRMAACIKHLSQRGYALVWLEVVPRVVYPFLVLLFLISVAEFWRQYCLPQLERIFSDFHLKLPAITRHFIQAGDYVEEFDWPLAVLIPIILFVGAALVTSSTARWYMPLAGFLYQMYLRGRVLRALGILVQVEKPVPEALSLLIDSGAFPRVLRRRLKKSRRLLTQGESLAEGLRRGGILPGRMAPLVHAAERMQNLPWALGELGDLQSNRAMNGMRRMSQALFPVGVIAIGALAGLMMLAIFQPLLTILEGMTG